MKRCNRQIFADRVTVFRYKLYKNMKTSVTPPNIVATELSMPTNYSIKTTVLATLLLSHTFIFAAQNQSPAVEVASVKPARTARFVPAQINPQSLRTVMSLADAIEWAYEVQNYQLMGGPAWLHREYYEIEIKTRMPVTKKEMRAALQSVLANRFKLKVHREAKEMSIYALIIGNPNRKPPISREPCAEDGCINVAPGVFMARNATMLSTADTLSNMVDRPVLDQTGLNGRYDFSLKFDPSSQKRFDGQVTSNTATDDPSIFAAIQDLGLKLEPRRAPIEILVIDGAEKPEAN
jgi:uncharacterized protein (TIGR03435 family)